MLNLQIISKSFNPRTHEGCDSPRGRSLALPKVSIHAPTRGATAINLINKVNHNVFQSTHPRGVRLSRLRALPCLSGFNPRTHEGCDWNMSTSPKWTSVSIHAPTRGATNGDGGGLFQYLFQSTHPRGVRQDRCTPIQLYTEFQSTHPRGVRLALQTCFRFGHKFQSTHPRGVRLSIAIFSA